MLNLDKRISALEQAIPRCDKVIFVILVGMGHVGKELTHIYDKHENHWHRLPHETERDFKDRATSETPRRESQVVLLFAEHLQE